LPLIAFMCWCDEKQSINQSIVMLRSFTTRNITMIMYSAESRWWRNHVMTSWHRRVPDRRGQVLLLLFVVAIGNDSGVSDCVHSECDNPDIFRGQPTDCTHLHRLYGNNKQFKYLIDVVVFCVNYFEIQIIKSVCVTPSRWHYYVSTSDLYFIDGYFTYFLVFSLL